jgi:hypothetical protein
LREVTVGKVELNQEHLVTFMDDHIQIDGTVLFMRDANGILNTVYALPPGSITTFSRETISEA